ncbi:MAG TPA: TonB-dependent receptor [Draconibacterium sp.]|nr:TonB-dependent receptor [Draconibacterium sp.]
MQRILIHLFILCFLIPQLTVAQEIGREMDQVIRGTVVDKQTQMPLPGANVVLLNTEPPVGTITNENGEFRLEHVPVGRRGIQVSFIGYYSAVTINLIVNSAKETVVFIELEEKVETTGEIMVVGNFRKDQAMNKMASVSARTFTVEEASRYAGSREDVARMAMNFAGVSGANDSRNDIIVRGNTPSGILWRLEDVDIPNPNHFAASGTTGGPVGMLNNNTLRNSDFFTGAFPAEYSNVFSGVFDLKMREGNNEKYEFMGQMGFNGFELGAEGPFKKGSKSSFLANYRYSTLQIFDLLGISFGTSGIPHYQDLNFKMNFPVKKGKITWFGLVGKSSITILDSEENSADLYTSEGMDLENGSSSVASGLNYTRFYNENTYCKFILSYVNQNGFTDLDEVKPENIIQPYYREDNKEEKLTFKTIFNKKISRRFSNRSGVTIDRLAYHLNAKSWDFDLNQWETMLNNRKSFFDGTNLYRTYSQFVYKFSDHFEVKPGVSFMYLGLNNKYTLEPRFGVNWKTSYRTSLNFGYGKHSRMQSLATYFIETVRNDGSVILYNKNLDFTKAHHWVLGFDALLSDQLRFKAETYYQYLYDVPVERKPSYFSMVNAGAEWGLNTRNSMVNKGEAWNYGIEFTLEKFYHKNYYFLNTLSLFDSKYKGSDGVKRNTAFNGNFVFNTLAGKEFPINNRSTLVFDLKMTWAGGNRYTPIDIEASRNTDEAFGTEYFEDQAYSKQFPNYFKADVKIGFRLDGKKVSQLWEFYVENVTNHKNPLNQLYSSSKDEIQTIYQLGFFPLFNYRIYF